MKKIIIPENYDYIGVYLTDKCHLNCSYCITKHHNASFGRQDLFYLTPEQWTEGLNRLELPEGRPISLQGGEPFLYKGVWEVLENCRHKVDVMTALPPHISRSDFEKMSTLDWNKREAPYPTIRVSYHKEQHDYKELIERIAELNDILSIGLYYLEHPSNTKDELDQLKSYAKKHGVELRSKEFLGEYNGKTYGTFLYPEAVCGEVQNQLVKCKNTVVPIAPDGRIYRCHSDLYFKRTELALGNIMDEEFVFPEKHLPCAYYGTCSECDVKVKTNHLQQYGYTSVDIILDGVKVGSENLEGGSTK